MLKIISLDNIQSDISVSTSYFGLNLWIFERETDISYKIKKVPACSALSVSHFDLLWWQFFAHGQFTAKNVTRAAACNLSRFPETSFSCFSEFNAYPQSPLCRILPIDQNPPLAKCKIQLNSTWIIILQSNLLQSSVECCWEPGASILIFSITLLGER